MPDDDKYFQELEELEESAFGCFSVDPKQVKKIKSSTVSEESVAIIASDVAASSSPEG